MAERKLNIEDYPSNSNAMKKRTGKIQPVAKAKVTERSSNSFIREDLKDVFKYAFWDVIVPDFKATLISTVDNMMHNLFYGTNAPTKTIRDKDRTYVSYSSISSNKSVPFKATSVHTPRSTRWAFETYILKNRQEAEEVLSRMVDYLDTYDCVPVSIFFELIGVEVRSTDNNFGWTSLKDAEVRDSVSGWYVKLPHPKSLD